MGFVLEQCEKRYKWKGKSIWLDPVKYPEYQQSLYTIFDDRLTYKYAVVSFRKTILLQKEINKLLCWITADTKYRLYVNDKYIGFGPTITGGDYGNKEPMDHWYYDKYKIQCDGRKISVKVEVCLQPEVMAEYSMGCGALLVDFEGYCHDRLVEIYGTDETWECCIDYSYVKPGVYHYVPLQYEPATVVNKNWNLQPRELPNLNHEKKFPISVHNPFYKGRVVWRDDRIVLSPGSPISFWLEFDKTYSAYLKVNAKGNAASNIILNTQEILGRTDRSEKIILGDEYVNYLGFKRQSVHYINVVASALWEPMELQISLDVTEYPVSQEGNFICDDELLNQVCELGKWTLRICRQDYHMDSPIHQETLGCTGDYMVQSLINYYMFGDRYLIRKDILRTAAWLKKNDYKMFHTSYSLMWIQMLVDYYWYTADDSLFQKCIREVEGLLERFHHYIGKHGLMEWAPNYMFMDWVQVGKYNLHHPPKVIGIGYMSALYYQALNNGQFICKYLRKDEKVYLYKKRAEQVKQSFKILWDDEKKLYRDGLLIEPQESNEWMPEGSGTYYSQHTNTMAVLYGLADRDKAKRIMTAVIEDSTLTQAQPYFYHFILEALYQVGLFETYGNDAMRRWGKLIDECKTGLKEVWSGFDCDYSHSWGASPTYHMMSKVLGVRVLEPGFKKVKIEPQLGDLFYAEGNIPTPYGAIYIRAQKKQGKTIFEVEKPEEIELG